MTRKKNIGLAATAPKQECTSVRCPWHGSLKIRGRLFQGTVQASKAGETAIIEWNYYHHLHKYERLERRKTRLAAHNPKCISAKPGDVVMIGECRPLSKMKRFVIYEKVKTA